MGAGGIGIWQLLIVLVIVLLLFGTKKLRNMGGDLGSAIKGFKKAVKEKTGDGEAAPDEDSAEALVESLDAPQTKDTSATKEQA